MDASNIRTFGPCDPCRGGLLAIRIHRWMGYHNAVVLFQLAHPMQMERAMHPVVRLATVFRNVETTTY